MRKEEMKKIENIKIGDVLFSKEHNCKITVEAFTTTDRIVCVWQNDKGELYRELLQLQDLQGISD